MQHLLMHPAFPDIVGDYARRESCRELGSSLCANDNGEDRDGLSDPLLSLIARAEIEATRLW